MTGERDSSALVRFTRSWTAAQPTVAAFVAASIRHGPDADDVLQRVAEVAAMRFDRYDASRRFLPWVLGIARNEILHALRSRARDRHEFVADALPELAAAFEELEPELEARRWALRSCLDRIRGRARAVLDRRYVDGLSTSAIAEALHLTASNVSVILHRTHRALRTCIEDRLRREA